MLSVNKNFIALVTIFSLAFIQSYLFTGILNCNNETKIIILIILYLLINISRFTLFTWFIFKGVSGYIKILAIAEALLSFIPLSMSYPTFQTLNWNLYFNTFDRQMFELSEKQKVVHVIYIGDSFTEGIGIEYAADRFDQQAAKKIKYLSAHSAATYNLGHSGWGTREELLELKRHKHKIDFLVWQYYVNDLEDSKPADTNSAMAMPFPARLSVTSNFLTGVFFSMMIRQNLMSTNNDLMQSDQKTIERHKRQIDTLTEYCRLRDINMILLYVPEIISGAENVEIKNHLISSCEKYNFSFINSGDLTRHLSISERTAGFFDPHASEEVHALWGDTIARIISGNLSE